MQYTPYKSGRAGLSLLEVILSIAIMGVALVSIGQLINLGYRSARQAQLRSDANILVDSKMAEVVSGVLPLEAASGASIEGFPDWVYSVDIQRTEILGLLNVTVEVTALNSSVPVRMSVARLVPDPDFDPLEDQQ